MTFNVPTKVFSQDTPLGKLPVIEDGDVTICESGAIVEHILERYDPGWSLACARRRGKRL